MDAERGGKKNESEPGHAVSRITESIWLCDERVLSFKVFQDRFNGKNVPLKDWPACSLNIMDYYHDQPRWAKVYLYIDMLDEYIQPESVVIEQLKKAIKFIKKNEHVGVAVNCGAGVSRSATVVIAYLIQEKGMSYVSARALVSRARPEIFPNPLFEKILKSW